MLIDSKAICEYFEETIDKAPMINGTAPTAPKSGGWSPGSMTQFYGDVVAPLMDERMEKRLVHRDPPDAQILREAMKTRQRASRLYRFPARSPELDGGAGA